jgi:hypothetical protein
VALRWEAALPKSVKPMRVGMNGHQLTFERAARLILHGDQDDDEEQRREQPRRIVSLPRVAWVEKRLMFWDDRGFATALAERKKGATHG